ncbi:MAG: DUF4070 domain-containing protein [Patescibacteria group bacterium]
MNILLVYPEFLDTFWSWKKNVKFVGKKAAFPPPGLLLIARMLPESWNLKLVDLNVNQLENKDIEWADKVFISAMITQKDSTNEIIAQCKKLSRPVVLGGPIFEIGSDKFLDAGCFFIGEAEDIICEFLEDVNNGAQKRIYKGNGFPDLVNSKTSMWSLIDHRDYASMIMQIGRGCPYGCTFCNVAGINGRVPRLRPERVFFAELEELYETGFRGAILLADDNVIGNKAKALVILSQLVNWQKEHNYPFEFTAEFPITLADDPELMDVLVVAGFRKVFLGLETPNRASLLECGKLQNANRDMVACVRKIQEHGLIPMSGFIVGFDSDSPDNFDNQMINFIQETGIVIAMVGVLQAPPGSKLYVKLEIEGRLLNAASGNNTDCEPNFAPKMPKERLIQGYKRIIKTIYSPNKYYERIRKFLENYNPSGRPKKKFSMSDFKALMMANLWIGLLGGLKVSYYYWKSLFYVIFSKKRRAFADVVALHIYGAHLREIAKGIRDS